MMDVNKDGLITKEDMMIIMKGNVGKEAIQNDELYDEVMSRMMEELGDTGDGKITFEQFKNTKGIQ